MPSNRAEYRRFQLDRKKHVNQLARAAESALLPFVRDMRARVSRGIDPKKALPNRKEIESDLISALAPAASITFNAAMLHGLQQAERYYGRTLPILSRLRKAVGSDILILKITEEEAANLGINTTRATVFEESTFGKIKTIAPNFIDSLRRMVDTSIAESEGRRELIARIITFEGQTKRTAARIAQTETTRLFNDGKLRGYKLSTVVKGKLWQTNPFGSGQVRHAGVAGLNGQQVGLEEKFSVMGESLDYPGDPAGSAWNIISCLCSMRPVTGR